MKQLIHEVYVQKLWSIILACCLCLSVNSIDQYLAYYVLSSSAIAWMSNVHLHLRDRSVFYKIEIHFLVKYCVPFHLVIKRHCPKEMLVLLSVTGYNQLSQNNFWSTAIHY